MANIQFWFDFASTYSYLSAMQIRQLKDQYPFSLHPFLLGGIFHKQGLNDSPFNIYPLKGEYMWRDMQRICEKLEIGFMVYWPPELPVNMHRLTGFLTLFAKFIKLILYMDKILAKLKQLKVF